MNNNNNYNKTNKQFNPISATKNNNIKSSLINNTNKPKENKPTENNKKNILNQNNSSPLLISNKIIGSAERSKNYINIEPKSKNKLGKAGNDKLEFFHVFYIEK